MKKKIDFKIPYEPPRVLDLGGGVAYADESKDCKSGGVALNNCSGGNSPASPSKDCKAGGSPGVNCSSGSMASGYKCNHGSFAGEFCKAGNVPAGQKSLETSSDEW